MRIFLGFLVVALALGGAVWLRDANLDSGDCRNRRTHEKVDCGTRQPGSGRLGLGYQAEPDQPYSWQDPLAIVIAIAGLGAGIAIVTPAFRR